jgi:hypothetical protein
MANLITRLYSNFRGVDFRGEEINLVRSPDSLNVWKDYKETESIRTRPELELKEAFDNTVWGVFFYVVGNNKMMLVHCGTKLYKIVDGVREVLFEGLNPNRSQSFIYNNIWYFKDGINYLEYDGQTIGEVVGTIPTTSIGRKALGGTTYEDVNLLTGMRINTFLADGISTEYHLDARNIDTDVQPRVEIADVELETTEYEVDTENGVIKFKTAPPLPLTDGQDNIKVTFRKTIAGHRERINHCTMLQVFDNRVFFSGNPEYPNTVFHCQLDDPRYCADLDRYPEGYDLAKVKGMVAGNNALWVFKEPSQANTTVFYHNPVLDQEYGKIYPSTHSSIATGCIGKAVNFNDDIAFFSDRGMEAINGDVTTEQVIAHRSSLVDRKLIAEEGYKDMILEEWEGYLLCFIGTNVYLADSRSKFQNGDHIEYDWFVWTLSKEITCTTVKDGILYLGTNDGVYTLTDNESAVESYFCTTWDNFNYPAYQKTTNKRGSIAEGTGDINVYVKTNNDSEWELVDTYYDVTDAFVFRIKKKKWKNISLKFHSNTRFSLETASLECFIGGYIKR